MNVTSHITNCAIDRRWPVWIRRILVLFGTAPSVRRNWKSSVSERRQTLQRYVVVWLGWGNLFWDRFPNLCDSGRVSRRHLDLFYAFCEDWLVLSCFYGNFRLLGCTPFLRQIWHRTVPVILTYLCRWGPQVSACAIQTVLEVTAGPCSRRPQQGILRCA